MAELKHSRPAPAREQHMHTHARTLTLAQSGLSNSPTRLSSTGPGGGGGPPCPRNLAATPDNRSLSKPGSSGNHQKIAPASREDKPKEGPSA